MAIASGLTVEAWSQAALQGFTDFLAPLNTFSTDFGGAISQRGKTVHVPLYTGGGAVTAFAGDYTTGADETISDVSVTVDQHEFVTAKLSDIEKKNTVADLEQLGVQMGADLAKSVFQNVLAVVTNANYGAAASTGAASAFDADEVIDIKDACDTGLMPMTGRGLVLSSSYYNALLKDASIKNANQYGSDQGIQAGMIPNLFGFRVYESTAVPANGENLVGFACNSSAIAVAMRYLEPQDNNGYVRAEALSDPDTGAVLGLRQFYLPETGDMYMTLECNWGKAVGIAAGIERIVSA
jgi:hypothetical protein